MTEGTAGSAAIVGTCTCGCCGPLVAKIAVLAAGPSIAAPLYWVFVDSASPLSAVFIVGSLLLFTGSLLYSVQAARQPDRSAAIIPAD
jgi:vacuolar-type H+-ATPase subunit I/STV1